MTTENSKQGLHEDLAGVGLSDPDSRAMVAGSPIRSRSRLAGFFLALFGVSLAVYLATLCPTIYEEGTGENVVCVWVFGVPHPPGFPLYCLLGKAFASLLAFGEVAFRVNVFSAVVGAGVIGAIGVLLRVMGFGGLAAGAAALALGFSSTFWRQSTIAEVYTLSTLLMVIQMWLLARWWRIGPGLASSFRHGAGWLLVLAFFFGLGLTVHYMHVLLLPAYFLAALIHDRRVVRRPLLVLGAAGAALVGFSLHGYTLVASRFDPLCDWGNPEDLGGFWAYLTASNYHSLMFKLSGPEMWANLERLFRALPIEWMWPGVGLAVAGLVILFRRSRRWSFFTVAVALVTTAWAISYNVPWEIEVYYLPLLLAMTVWIAGAMDWVVSRLRGISWLRHGGVAVYALPALLLVAHWQHNDLSNATFVRDHGQDIVSALDGPEAVLFVPTSNPTFALTYLRMTEPTGKGPTLVFRDQGYAVSFEEAQGKATEDGRLPEMQFLALAIAIQGRPVYSVERWEEQDLPGLVQIPWGPVYRLAPKSEGARLAVNARKIMGWPTRFDPFSDRVYGTEHRYLICQRLLILADYEWARGRPENADLLYEKVRALGLGASWALSRLGFRYAEQGREDLAMKAYEECLSRGENDAARIRLGNLHLRKRRDTDAEREFRHVLVRQPDNVEARIGFASVFAIRGKPEEGIAHLQLAVKSNPVHLNALRMLGIAYLSVGRGDDARVVLEAALRINPMDVEIRDRLKTLPRRE